MRCWVDAGGPCAIAIHIQRLLCPSAQALVRIATSLDISSAEDAAELRIVVFSVGNMAQWLPCAKVGKCQEPIT